MTAPHAAVVLPYMSHPAVALEQSVSTSNPPLSGSLRSTNGARPRVSWPARPPSHMLASNGRSTVPFAAL